MLEIIMKLLEFISYSSFTRYSFKATCSLLLYREICLLFLSRGCTGGKAGALGLTTPPARLPHLFNTPLLVTAMSILLTTANLYLNIRMKSNTVLI